MWFSHLDENLLELVYLEEDDNGEEHEVRVPAIYEVCARCDGKGKHTNPNIDGHGITQEEWDRDWSYEEREAYFDGRYDITCVECKGKRVQASPKWDKLSDEIKAQLESYDMEEAAYVAEVEMERKFGC